MDLVVIDRVIWAHVRLTNEAHTAPTMPSMHSRDELAEHFRQLGVRPGQCVMLHASVRAVGAVAGGPHQIHLALKDALTPEGSLVMYAGCPAHTDEIGRGNLTADEERELLAKLPVFDPDSARSQRENGILVEFLRTYPESRVNGHVARFVVWGSRGNELLRPQPWNYAFGAGSLLDRFVAIDGRIILPGCDHDDACRRRQCRRGVADRLVIADQLAAQVVHIEVEFRQNNQPVTNLQRIAKRQVRHLTGGRNRKHLAQHQIARVGAMAHELDHYCLLVDLPERCDFQLRVFESNQPRGGQRSIARAAD